MHTAFLSASLSTLAGGIFEIERQLAINLSALGIQISAYGLLDEKWEQDSSLWAGTSCHVFAHKGPAAFGYAPALTNEILNTDVDLAHLHTLWMYPSVAIHQWHRKRSKPYIVTPNGMLEPWALANSAWKKKLAGFMYENRMLRSAACLQANTEKEAADFRAYGLKNPICIIPNGVELPLEESEGLKVEGRRTGEKILLFLGRLHPKKGLVNALRAWAEVRGQGSGVRGQEEWQFVVAGWDQGGHEAELKCLCDELGLAWADASNVEGIRDQVAGVRGQKDATAQRYSSSLSPDSWPLTPVVFTGPAFGNAKDQLLRQASAFILPSFSEGLPMSVLEAWAYQLPVLMTDACNLPEGFAADAAIRIGTGIRGQDAGVRRQESGVSSQESGDRAQPLGIDEGMRALIEMTDAERMVMGQRGRTLVEQHFTWPQVAAQMKEVYEWVLGGGPKPGCVR